MTNTDAMQYGTSSPDVARHVLAHAMLDAWSRENDSGDNGWDDAMDAVISLEQATGLPPFIGEYLGYAARLLDLLPTAGYNTVWTYGRVIDRICRPFAVWMCTQERQNSIPPEPVWRHWLQSEVQDYFPSDAPVGIPYDKDTALVVTLLLPVKASRADEAIVRVCALISGLPARALGSRPSTLMRYWLISETPAPSMHNDRWMIQAAFKVGAHTPHQADVDVAELAGRAFEEADIEWEYETPFGHVLAAGSFPRVAGHPANEVSVLSVAPTCQGGLLPAWRH